MKGRSSECPSRSVMARKSRGCTSSGSSAATPSAFSVSSSTLSFFSSGLPCTRYSVPTPRLLEFARHRDVREDHALLDELVRLVALVEVHALDAARGVDIELGLGGVELQRAALVTRLQQRAIHIQQWQQFVGERAELGARFRLCFEQRRERLRVGEARRRAHDGGIEMRVQQLPGARDDHVGRETQPVDFGLQRTQHVRQCERQHRNHARREIHARAALARTGVERRAAPHVVTHVGNRDDEPEALGMRLGVHRVVEVLGVFAIDGDQRQFAQVDALRATRRIDCIAVALRFADGFGRKIAWQVEARDGRLAGELHRLLRIETLEDARLRRRTRARVTRDGGDDPVAMMRAAELAGATRQRMPMRRSAAVTNAVRPCTSSVPTNAFVACSRIFSSFPE